MERVTGLDVLPDIADRGRAFGARHFFYGGGDGVAVGLATRLAEAYPGLIVAGTETPPFRPLTPAEDDAMVERLNAARPDYIWVGLGRPKQDHWLAEHRDKLDAPVLMAVGAAFDIVGGYRPQHHAGSGVGLEWLFRLIQEPRRLARRYTVVNALDRRRRHHHASASALSAQGSGSKGASARCPLVSVKNLTVAASPSCRVVRGTQS